MSKKFGMMYADCLMGMCVLLNDLTSEFSARIEKEGREAVVKDVLDKANRCSEKIDKFVADSKNDEGERVQLTNSARTFLEKKKGLE